MYRFFSNFLSHTSSLLCNITSRLNSHLLARANHALFQEPETFICHGWAMDVVLVRLHCSCKAPHTPSFIPDCEPCPPAILSIIHYQSTTPAGSCLLSTSYPSCPTHPLKSHGKWCSPSFLPRWILDCMGKDIPLLFWCFFILLHHLVHSQLLLLIGPIFHPVTGLVLSTCRWLSCFQRP